MVLLDLCPTRFDLVLFRYGQVLVLGCLLISALVWFRIRFFFKLR